LDGCKKTSLLATSGSGKTSLVNALAGRLPSDSHAAQSGAVLINGRDRLKNYRAMTSYVMQVRERSRSGLKLRFNPG
jgi:ABC-type multidrug transport system ATPase subunit